MVNPPHTNINMYHAHHILYCLTFLTLEVCKHDNIVNEQCLTQSFLKLHQVFQGNSLMRILNVAAFAVSGYASTEGRICKPFNPLLGETYEADYPDKGVRFFSEKVPFL